MDFHSCLFEIQTRYDALTPVEKRIADYIALYGEEVIHMTVRQLAKCTGTASSAVLRLFRISRAENIAFRRYLQKHAAQLFTLYQCSGRS